MKNDIIFISFNESNAEENFRHLLDIVPHGGIGRVRNIIGITKAHQMAAEKAGTTWFYVVDGDNWVCPEFKFDYEPTGSPDSTYVWRSRNGSNDLIYGYGGIKMFHRQALLKRLKDFEMGADMTTGLFKNFNPLVQVASETRFATSPIAAWRGAFRECAKLSSKSIARQKNEETEERLRVWTTQARGDFSGYVLAGAVQGKLYGETHSNISAINDFNWLVVRFQNS